MNKRVEEMFENDEVLLGGISREIDHAKIPTSEELRVMDINAMTDDLLQSLDLPQLYQIIHRHLDSIGLIRNIKANLDFRMALVMGWVDAIKSYKKIPNGSSCREIRSAMVGSESRFLNKLEKLGVNVDVQSEISEEDFSRKPHLFMANHQGGSLEINVLTEMMQRAGVKNFRYVMKKDLASLPLIGEVISAVNPIFVDRAQLKTVESKKKEIDRIAGEMVETLIGGESVLFFVEGTRSKSGAIAHTENRRNWCYQLSDAIEAAAQKYNGKNWQKSYVVIDTLSTLENPVEKNPLTAMARTNGNCAIKIASAEGLEIKENAEDIYDPSTLFGKMRTDLKGILISRIREML